MGNVATMCKNLCKKREKTPKEAKEEEESK